MTIQLIVKCHEFLDKGNKRHLSPGVCEMEAEAVAYVTGKYFGFSNEDSLNCLALFGVDNKLIQYYWIVFKGLRGISLVNVARDEMYRNVPRIFS